jgi:hypothetical protein
LAKRLLLTAGLMISLSAVVMPANKILESETVRDERIAVETGSIGTPEDPAAIQHPVRRETDDFDAQKMALPNERLAPSVHEMLALQKAADEARGQLSQATKDKESTDRVIKDLRERLGRASVRLRLARRRMARNVARRRTFDY